MRTLVRVAAAIVVAALFYIRELPVPLTGEEFDKLRMVHDVTTIGLMTLLALMVCCNYVDAFVKFCLFLFVGCNIFALFKVYVGTVAEPKYSDYTFIFGIALICFCLTFRKPIAHRGNNLYQRWQNKKYGKDASGHSSST